MKISARLAISRAFWERRAEAMASAAGTPRVLPLRRISVTGWEEERRGARWEVVESAVSSLRDWLAREKTWVEDIMDG